MAALALAVGGLAGAAGPAGQAGPAPAATSWPTDTWTESTPAAEGVDGAVLEAIDAEIRAGRFGLVDSVLIVRHGRVVLDRRYEHDYAAAAAGRDMTPHQYNYFHPDWHPYYQQSGLHTMQSVTKSVTSAVVGVAIRRGNLPGTGAHVMSYLNEREVPDPDGRKEAITVEDVLTMRAGLEWDEWGTGYDDPRNDCAQLEASRDWIGFVLAKPMAADPGTSFVYNSGATQLLSGVLRRATGRAIDAYARQHLFAPIGIASFHWKKTPDGLPDTEGGLYLAPRDLARLGLLYLHDGVWDGRRLLPEGWVERSVTPWVDRTPLGSGYGYGWWILEDGTGDRPKAYAAMGFGGQHLVVVPSLDLVAVFTGWNIHGRRYPSMVTAFGERIVPAVR
jgi:CubicO group peptidase (beta-lactamase class C family)